MSDKRKLDRIIEEAIKIVKRIEPDVDVIDNDKKKKMNMGTTMNMKAMRMVTAIEREAIKKS